MKTILIALFLGLLMTGCTAGGTSSPQGQSNIQQSQTDEAAKTEITTLVKNFGAKLQTVSLQAPSDVLKKSMNDNYRDFVTLELLTKWQNDPKSAPGRAVSSPWPDRIDNISVNKLSNDKYQARGEIIEITSVEKEKGGFAAKRPITLSISKINNKWLIDGVTLGEYQESTQSVIYKNSKYGFDFVLPNTWKGYTTAHDKWEGLPIGGNTPIETGPTISIRHPAWTKEKPRQDIPIMVFTLAQWNLLQQEKFHIGAAPMGPSELGRNNKYVFALPARYNYAFPTGYQEVEEILKGKPLKPFSI